MKVNSYTSSFSVNLSKHQITSTSLSRQDRLFDKYSYKKSLYAENARADRRFANWLNVRNFISIMKNSKSLSKAAKKLLFIYLLASQVSKGEEGVLLDFSEFRDELSNKNSRPLIYSVKQYSAVSLPINNLNLYRNSFGETDGITRQDSQRIYD